MKEATVLQWYAEPGCSVNKGDPLVQVELDKATMDLEAPDSGTLDRIVAHPDAVVRVGELLAEFDITEEITPPPLPTTVVETSSSPAVPPTPSKRNDGTRGRRLSPAARRRARESAAAKPATHPETIENGAESVPHLRSSTAPDESARFVALNSLQRSKAERITDSHRSIVQVTTVTDVDMTEIARLRERIPVSVTAIVIKAAVQAVPAFPLINARLEGSAIVLNKTIDMGVAVATEAGLITPVIRNAESKTLARIERDVTELEQQARKHGLSSSGFGDATMTVSNLGALGSLLFTPIVVEPQSAALGVGRITELPVVRDGQMAVRDIMYLCLSYDHRFIDGAIAVGYLQRVRAFLEDPFDLLWDTAEEKNIQ